MNAEEAKKPCLKAPEWAKGKHSIGAWTDTDGTHYWCQWGGCYFSYSDMSDAARARP